MPVRFGDLGFKNGLVSLLHLQEPYYITIISTKSMAPATTDIRVIAVETKLLAPCQTGIGSCRATDLWRTAMSDIGTPAYCCDKTGIMRPLGALLAQKLACRCVQLTGWME